MSNVIEFDRCANPTCSRRAKPVPEHGGRRPDYCSRDCQTAMRNGGNGTRTLCEVRVGMDTYRMIVELAAEYGATVQEVIQLLLEEEFGEARDARTN